jgi:hypothetical protein
LKDGAKRDLKPINKQDPEFISKYEGVIVCVTGNK